MAKVRLARGTDATIRSIHTAGTDGRLYLAKDTRKIYADITNTKTNTIERLELNPGILLKTSLTFLANTDNKIIQQTFEKIDIDLQSEQVMILVIGMDQNYYEHKVKCTQAINSNTLEFTYEGTLTEDLTVEVQIFIYHTAGTSRTILPDVTQDTTEEEWQEIYNTDGLYSFMQNLGINEEDDVVLGTNVAGIIKSETEDNLTTIYSTQIPDEEEILSYIAVLPEGTVINTIINTQNQVVLPTDIDTTTLQSVIIQPVDENEEFNQITGYEWQEGILYANGVTITQNIPVTIMVLQDDNINVINPLTIETNNWQENNGVYTSEIEVNLVCAGGLAPIISSADVNAEYNYITDIVVNNDKTTITCTAMQKPTTNINLIIMDFI